jgi:hypothetical protein
VTSLLLALTAVVAVAAVGIRRVRLARRWRSTREGPGSSPERSIPVRSWSEIDAALGARACPCGGRYELTGEGTRETGGHRYRVARLVCQACEIGQEVFFDTTELLH